MSSVRAILFDIGGVLLTNGWDHTERAAVYEQFHVNAEEFEARHPDVYDAWERGRITLDDYLNATLFDEPQLFTKEDFLTAMKAQSRELDGGASGVLRQLAAENHYLLGFLNNEARELNKYRLDTFGLRSLGEVFLCSCYVGLRKPEPAIYRLAVDVLQLPASEVIFVDDRVGNVQAAAAVGLNAIRYTTEQALREDLKKRGVEFGNKGHVQG